MSQKILFNFIALVLVCQLYAQKTTPTIKNEADVPSYKLPHLLTSMGGEEIDTPLKWDRLRRPEIHSYFAPSLWCGSWSTRFS